jgi:CRP-like cAMP-binding protein
MRKILYFLGELNDQDIDWIAGVGTIETFQEGQIVVRQGEPIEVLYITPGGRFDVSLANASGVIAPLGVGEVVGELSFLDARPPVASVTALEKSTVLAIPVARLKAKLQSDFGFASRFYRALGVLLSHRLRDTTLQLAYGVERRLDDDVESQGEMSLDFLDTMSLAAARFDMIIRRLAHADGQA